jgi:predicted N-acyltransferase
VTRAPVRFEFRSAPGAPDRAAAEWNTLVPDSPPGFYLCHEWLTSLRGGKGYADLTWSIHDERQRVVGLLPVYTTPKPQHYALYDLHALFGAAGGTDWGPQTLLGSRSGYANVPLIQAPEVLPAWLDAALDATERTECASGAIAYLDRATAAAVHELAPTLPVLLTGFRCQISLLGKDFDDYLAGLSHRRRQTVHRELRLFERGGNTIRVGRLDAGDSDTLAPLLANVQHRHGSTVEVDEVAGYLRSCAEPGLRERTALFTCHHGDDVVAFMLAYRHSTALTVRVVGLDYDRIGQHAEYFTTLIYEPVRYALRHGLTALDLGAEGYRHKLQRGGQLIPLWTVLTRSPVAWRPSMVEAHDAQVVSALAESCADLVPDLDSLCRLEDVGESA